MYPDEHRALSQPRGNHVIYKVVRDELTLIHQGLWPLCPSSVPLADVGAEDVAGRDLRNAELGHEELAWVPLPTPGAPKRRTGPGRKLLSAGAAVGSVIVLAVNGLTSLPALAATDAATLGSEAVVVAHDELRFDLLGRVHGDTDDDEQRGATKVEVDAETVGHPTGQMVKDGAYEPDMVEMDSADEQGRNDRDDDEVERADRA